MNAVAQTLPLVGTASMSVTTEATLHVMRITELSTATITAAVAKIAATGDARYAIVIQVATQTMQDAIKTSAKVIAAAATAAAEFA